MRYAVVTALVVMSVTPAKAYAQVRAQTGADEIITIDGTKNPELVPQWTVWNSGLRYLAKDDSEQLPTVVLRAVTPEQTVMLMKEAHAAEAFERECAARAMQFGRTLLAERPDLDIELANTKVVEASMACRRHTLEVRDRLLASLSPTGAAALRGWVESLKVGWTTTLKKSHLKTYLSPE
jgi:hypothetical protein